ncbi:MAG: DNA repair protein RecO, partial [Candidatus Mariimomonas ferrooxydans]
MLTRTEGIVLKTLEYSEADLIVTHLTLAKGITKTFAKSPRKTKSRFGSSLEPLTHARISLWGKEQSMPKLTQSDILNPFQALRENIKDFVYMSKLAEILISLIPEGIPNYKVYIFFLNMMNLLESSGQKQKDVLYLISQIRLLVLLGYAPNTPHYLNHHS